MYMYLAKCREVSRCWIEQKPTLDLCLSAAATGGSTPGQRPETTHTIPSLGRLAACAVRLARVLCRPLYISTCIGQASSIFCRPNVKRQPARQST